MDDGSPPGDATAPEVPSSDGVPSEGPSPDVPARDTPPGDLGPSLGAPTLRLLSPREGATLTGFTTLEFEHTAPDGLGGFSVLVDGRAVSSFTEAIELSGGLLRPGAPPSLAESPAGESPRVVS